MDLAPNPPIFWLLIGTIGVVLFGIVMSLYIWRRERAPWMLAFTGLLACIAIGDSLFLVNEASGWDPGRAVQWLQLATSLLAVLSVLVVGGVLRSSRKRSREALRVRSALQEVSAARSASGELDFFERASPRITEVLGADASIILGFDETHHQIRILAVSVGGVLQRPETPTIDVAGPLCVEQPKGWMEALQRALPSETRLRDWSPSELLAFPLMGAEGQERGVLAVLSGDRRSEREDLLPALQILARRTQDELERLERDERLRLSERRYRDLFEESLEPRYVVDLDGKPLDANQSCIELFGYESLEHLLREFDLTWHFPRDVRQETQRMALDGGGIVDLEGQFRTRQGDVRYCVISARFGEDAAGRNTMRGSIRDVTEHRRLSDQLSRSQRMETVGRMAGGVAHDFNNILMVIEGATDLLSTQHTEDTEMQSDVELIRSALNRASAFTQRLLLLGQQREPTPEIIDLRGVVGDLENILSHAAGGAVRLRVDLGPEPAWVLADASQLEQVLLNLAVNARDAMPAGGLLQIRVDHEDRSTGEPGVRLIVEDDGVGISDRDLEHIFEPFFSTKDASVGTGLGLATVQSLVEALGGTMDVSSTVGEGTRFEMVFPRCSGPSASVPEDQGSEGSAASEHVLVVDDDPAVATVMRRLLERMGYRVTVVYSGPDALDALRRSPDVEIMITDVVMPGMDGIELAETAQEQRPDLRVLLVSGYSEQRVDLRPTDRHIEFLPKPVGRDQLAATLRSLLDAG